MIKSLTFTGEFGYINEKIKEPMCPVRGYNGEKTSSWFYRDMSKREKEMFEKWKKEHAEWEKHKDDYINPHLVKNLLSLCVEFRVIGCTVHLEPHVCIRRGAEAASVNDL